MRDKYNVWQIQHNTIHFNFIQCLLQSQLALLTLQKPTAWAQTSNSGRRNYLLAGRNLGQDQIHIVCGGGAILLVAEWVNI